MSYWRARAVEHIADLVKALPDDATLTQRKAALKGQGWPAHEGTFWGKKMWGQEVKRYLTRFGPPQRVKSFERYSPITGQYEMVDLNQLSAGRRECAA